MKKMTIGKKSKQAEVNIQGINMAESKDTKYRNTRETGLNWLASQFGGMAGKVVKEKRKKKEEAKKK